MSSDSKISPYNLADCKNTTDDALQNYLKSLKLRQSHFYTDVRLALGFTAVIISAINFAFDYKLGFEKTKYWTAAAVVVYFVLNGAFTYWMWAVEKDIIFTGEWKNQKITISSKTKKNDPTYYLAVRNTWTSSNTQQDTEAAIEAPFMQWFTADGYFVAKPFQHWLASNVPLIAEADPKNASIDVDTANLQSETVKPVATLSPSNGTTSSSKKEATSKRRKG